MIIIIIVHVCVCMTPLFIAFALLYSDFLFIYEEFHRKTG